MLRETSSGLMGYPLLPLLSPMSLGPIPLSIPHIKKHKGHLKCWLLWLLSFADRCTQNLVLPLLHLSYSSITNDFPISKPKVEGPLYLSDEEVALLWT